jgi:general secretion pathway protein H
MRNGGFTLIEMLVALTIMGLVGGALTLGVQNRLPGLRLDSATAAALQELRERQAEAVWSDKENSLALSDLRHPGRGPHARRLARIGAVQVEIHGDDPAHPDELRFLPGGWSPGGKLILKEGTRRSVLAVDWPLGLVHADTAR